MPRYKSLTEAIDSASRPGKRAPTIVQATPKVSGMLHDLEDAELAAQSQAAKVMAALEQEKKVRAQVDPEARKIRIAELEARITASKQELRALRDESAGLAYFLTVCPKEGEVKLTNLYMGYVGVMMKALYPAYKRAEFTAALEAQGYVRKRKSDGWYFQGLGSPWGKGLVEDGT